MFINRHAELINLETHYRSGRAELFVLYGRRRVGKTELVRHFCADKPHIFFIATLSADNDQLASFSQEIWRFTHANISDGFTFPSWEAAFRALADLPGRPVVVLDEFTYLISGNKTIPSILQKVWDELLRNTQVFLILCGSYVGMMEREILGYQAPLYGRRTGSYLLPALELPAAAVFLPAYTPIQQIEAWAVLGGMPYYLATFSDQADIFANIRARILDSQGMLRREPQMLLMEELREPRNYFSILRALAQGSTRLNEISQGARVGDATTTARYLNILQDLRVVNRNVPATESRPDKNKRGLYQITDAFLRFWFRYVHPNQGSLDLGLADAVLAQRVRPTFDQFVSYAFEEAARAYVARLARAGQLAFLPERIGSWWDSTGEVDVVAVSEADGALLLGECKWSVNPVGTDILDDLQRKARLVDPQGRWPAVSYALFAKSGFTPALLARAADENVRLVAAEALVTDDPGS
ncbi:ATP-binding protein [Candidatus Amarolinea dominans]|uniref:ATP-binding protein n=1 Tax=Candidatus Amarolinea dominans TaxID=3140696 RepID=UPI0031357AF3|nr:ATP-binding protein [Anaerolineae bacterium]MBK9092438.1 ATP-binding protein [Anaerolineae bacterium]